MLSSSIFMSGGGNMKVKNRELKWYVLNWDFNNNKLYDMNIFSEEFKIELYKVYRNKQFNKLSDLKDYLDRYFRWRYMYRREYEMQVGDLLSKEEDFVKIDVYRQLEKNLDRITEYVNNYLEIGL